MRGRLLLVSVFIAAMVASVTFGNNGAIAAEKKFISIAGGPTGGTFYTMAVGITKMLNEKGSNINCSPETGGSVMNTRRVGANKVAFAFATADTAYHAFKGGPEFKELYPDIRAVFSGHASHWHMVTLKKTGIRKIEDLRGKKVAIGYPGGSVESVTKEILKEHNLIPDKDFKKFYFRHTGVVTGLKDGVIDAGAILTGAPSGALMDLATTHDMVLLPIDEKMLNTVLNKYPYYLKGAFEPGIYKGIDNPVLTVTVGTYMITHKSTNAKLCYEVARIIDESTTDLAEIHPAGKQWSIETVKKGIAIPVHPGAVKYFEEQGVHIQKQF